MYDYRYNNTCTYCDYESVCRIEESLSSLNLDSIPDSEAEDDHINMANFVKISSW